MQTRICPASDIFGYLLSYHLQMGSLHICLQQATYKYIYMLLAANRRQTISSCLLAEANKDLLPLCQTFIYAKKITQKIHTK